MTPSIQSKLPNVGTTIFTVMSTRAAEHNAINLGQGFPDFAMSEELTGLVSKAMSSGHNQYVHMNGLPLLRERIAEKVKRLYHTEINPVDVITITPGGTSMPFCQIGFWSASVRKWAEIRLVGATT